jgi:energy-coupling factor transporter ATP-binding protein EcfA2
MARELALPVAHPRRIFIIGQSGSGKSTLAHRLGEILSVPVTDLDPIYREGGGNGPSRTEEARDADLTAIEAEAAWIVEGIHLDGSNALMDRAELIIWLDHISGWRSSGRIMRRFVSGAWQEVRQQRGWRRFFRFGDYARHVRELGRAIPEAHAYSSSNGGAPVTRAQVAARLDTYGKKVLRCATDADVEALVSQIRASARSS